MKIALDELTKAIKSDENIGFCLTCGEVAFDVEPDARNYTCECCGAKMVFGAEEILIMEEYETKN